jgi:DNA-binding NtrC family response regulator
MARILIIDDDDQIREMLKLFLEYAGYDVLSAADGKSGMALFNANPSEVVITDILMPEQEGLETIIALHKENPDLSIIAMSGGGHLPADQYLTFARKMGARHTFLKPVNCSVLLEAVKESINRLIPA